ncbi:membrane protein [Frateuria defendens]|uniref:EamA family transporter n=1 Tax=Frateuria defendens TaxID=2219559 RepID=UPI00066FD355|nr:membrane protein [Frateuria defendens]
MSFVLLSVLCSVLVSVLLKLARRSGLDVGQMVAWNYLLAGALVLLTMQPALAPLHQRGAPWPALAGLGVLLPIIFLALGASVRHAGIVRSDVAQRLSLLLSLLAAFVLFGQALTTTKAAGIALGLAALAALVWRNTPEARAEGAAAWLYPLAVFAGFGAIDILFKQVAAAGVPLGTSLLAMFALSLVVAFALLSVRVARGLARLDLRSLGAGLLLGLFNFGNILFYLRAHRALPHDPALVFASMNLGVVALGTVVGVLGFRERLSGINVAGLALAVVAIGLLARG